MKNLLLSLYALFTFTNCASPQEKEQGTGTNPLIDNEGQSPERKSIDTLACVQRAELEIFQRLEGQHIRGLKKGERVSFYVEFFEDTTGVEPSEIIWEYYRIDGESLVSGDLNGDGLTDFALRSVGGAVMGNLFFTEWHVFVSDGGAWKGVKNDFGGGKFSDMETVVAIEKQTLKTEFQELGKETLQLKEAVALRDYTLVGNELERVH